MCPPRPRCYPGSDEPEYEASPSRTDRNSTSKPLAIGAVVVLILAAALVFRFTGLGALRRGRKHGV